MWQTSSEIEDDRRFELEIEQTRNFLKFHRSEEILILRLMHTLGMTGNIPGQFVSAAMLYCVDRMAREE